MAMTVGELATRIGAQVRGDAARAIDSCAGIEEAGAKDVTFVANSRYLKPLMTTKAGAAIVSSREAEIAPKSLTLLIAEDPYFAFREAMVALAPARAKVMAGISDKAVIDASAKLGKDCCVKAYAVIEAGAVLGERCVIHPHCTIGQGAVLGDDCVLYPGVTIYDSCVLGQRVILHAGCVIGQDGFGYATHQREGEELAHHKIPPVGNAVIEDDVEMGAGCSVDRATVGSTRVGRGSKFSNGVTIGHGAQIGRHNLFVAQVGIAGSTKTGDYVVAGGQVGIAGHLSIGQGAQIAAQSGVMDDIPTGEKWGGTPAQPWHAAKRSYIGIMRMDDLLKEARNIMQRLTELEAKVNENEP
ncbi:MAG: UDP-3-O-(3-hydroxymyristoyl)glucosamine N-acyltransferase [Phycisphaeraceae bacterium]